MIKRFVAWLKGWSDALSDPSAWDDSNDPCPYKCNCKDKKEKN